MWITVEQSGGVWSGNVISHSSGHSLFVRVPREAVEAFGISAGELYDIRVASKGRAAMVPPCVPGAPEAPEAPEAGDAAA